MRVDKTSFLWEIYMSNKELVHHKFKQLFSSPVSTPRMIYFDDLICEIEALQ